MQKVLVKQSKLTKKLNKIALKVPIAGFAKIEGPLFGDALSDVDFISKACNAHVSWIWVDDNTTGATLSIHLRKFSTVLYFDDKKYSYSIPVLFI